MKVSDKIAARSRIAFTKRFVSQWDLLTPADKESAAKKIHYIYRNIVELSRVIRPIIVIPGRSAGHIHFTKSDAIFYVHNRSLDTVFIVLTASHQDSKSLYSSSGAREEIGYLKQFLAENVDASLVDETACEVIESILGEFGLDFAFTAAREIDEPEDAEDTVDGLDVSQFWRSVILRDARELTAAETKQFIDTFMEDSEPAGLSEELRDWVADVVLPELENRWFSWLGDIFREDAAAETERIAVKILDRLATAKTQVESERGEGLETFDESIGITPDLSEMEARLKKLEAIIMERAALAEEWSKIDIREVEESFERLHAEGNELDEFYALGLPDDFDRAVRGLREIGKGVNIALSAVDDAKEAGKTAWMLRFEDAGRATFEWLMPENICDLTREKIESLKEEAEALTEIRHLANFRSTTDRLESGFEFFGKLQAVNVGFKEVKARCQVLDMERIDPPLDTERINNVLEGVETTSALDDAASEAERWFQALQESVETRWIEFNAKKRRALKEALDHIIAECESIRDLLLHFAESITDEYLAALDDELEEFIDIMIPFCGVATGESVMRQVRSRTDMRKGKQMIIALKRKEKQRFGAFRLLIRRGVEGLIEASLVEFETMVQQVKKAHRALSSSPVHRQSGIYDTLWLLRTTSRKLFFCYTDIVVMMSRLKYGIPLTINKTTIHYVSEYERLRLKERWKPLSEVVEPRIWKKYQEALKRREELTESQRLVRVAYTRKGILVFPVPGGGKECTAFLHQQNLEHITFWAKYIVGCTEARFIPFSDLKAAISEASIIPALEKVDGMLEFSFDETRELMRDMSDEIGRYLAQRGVIAKSGGDGSSSHLTGVVPHLSIKPPQSRRRKGSGAS